ncbi:MULTISPECIES: helix-turn-helix domain-containing protein [unclassified Cryobacterium]|uniref:helix-turn-helix domain-containing protein n=1 Tax=unclassified Cryobacterium TaxID=2649013 RepID=UPI0027DC02C5|nr:MULTISPECIES: helix-turn-helix domain-containing protein [unclassified Cryobacterium]
MRRPCTTSPPPPPHQPPNDSQIRSALKLIHNGETTAQVVRDLGISRSTFYRRAGEISS